MLQGHIWRFFVFRETFTVKYIFPTETFNILSKNLSLAPDKNQHTLETILVKIIKRFFNFWHMVINLIQVSKPLNFVSESRKKKNQAGRQEGKIIA